jgi:hypothetical protein
MCERGSSAKERIQRARPQRALALARVVHSLAAMARIHEDRAQAGRRAYTGLWIVGLVGIAAAGAWLIASGDGGLRPVVPPSLESVFDLDARLTLKDATRVEVFRLVPHDQDEALRSKPGLERFAGYAVDRHGGMPSVLQLARLKEALLDAQIYEPACVAAPGATCARVKFCGGLHPGVGLRFTAPGSRQLDVLLCFQCDDIGVVLGRNEKVPESSWPATDLDTDANPYRIRTWDISRGRQRLLELAKALFPKDPELQKLLPRELLERPAPAP